MYIRLVPNILVIIHVQLDVNRIQMNGSYHRYLALQMDHVVEDIEITKGDIVHQVETIKGAPQGAVVTITSIDQGPSLLSSMSLHAIHV